MEELIEISCLRIKITKCSFESFWYNAKVGETYNVSTFNCRDFYTIENGPDKGILRIDAEIIS